MDSDGFTFETRIANLLKNKIKNEQDWSNFCDAFPKFDVNIVSKLGYHDICVYLIKNKINDFDQFKQCESFLLSLNIVKKMKNLSEKEILENSIYLSLITNRRCLYDLRNHNPKTFFTSDIRKIEAILEGDIAYIHTIARKICQKYTVETLSDEKLWSLIVHKYKNENP
tara:strand:+ start:21045 stop:21551 length:507 start_codon:yes stop_codon:yes gene_type:complete